MLTSTEAKISLLQSSRVQMNGKINGKAYNKMNEMDIRKKKSRMHMEWSGERKIIIIRHKKV